MDKIDLLNISDEALLEYIDIDSKKSENGQDTDESLLSGNFSDESDKNLLDIADSNSLIKKKTKSRAFIAENSDLDVFIFK